MFIETLNQIQSGKDNWYCVVFDFAQVNAGGLYITYEQFLDMTVEPFGEYSFRTYKKSKKIVVSGLGTPPAQFCALDLKYQNWRCILCKKISNVNESKCFCETYSKCWTPMNGQINGLIFSNNLDFSYHFNPDSFSNLPL